MNIIDFDGFVFTPLDRPPVPQAPLNARRTCPRCNDADGEVHWFGGPICPWCDYSKGETF